MAYETSEGVSRDRRLLDKLVREVLRCEGHAVDHARREARRLRESDATYVPPVVALRGVAEHADAMRDRFDRVVAGHEIGTARNGIAATLASLRHVVVDRVVDPERAYRTALLDLRHGIDVVRLLREVARAEGLFGIIRWCDDWLGVRRTLVAHVEAQLSWFTSDETVPHETYEAEAEDDRDTARRVVTPPHEEQDRR